MFKTVSDCDEDDAKKLWSDSNKPKFAQLIKHFQSFENLNE